MKTVLYRRILAGSASGQGYLSLRGAI